MAKKARIKKTKKRKQREPLVTVHPECDVQVRFTRAVIEDRETIRRLAHRVVDLLADSGDYDQLGDSISHNLFWMLDDFVVKNVTDLIDEARAARKEVPGG